MASNPALNGINVVVNDFLEFRANKAVFAAVAALATAIVAGVSSDGLSASELYTAIVGFVVALGGTYLATNSGVSNSVPDAVQVAAGTVDVPPVD